MHRPSRPLSNRHPTSTGTSTVRGSIPTHCPPITPATVRSTNSARMPNCICARFWKTTTRPARCHAPSTTRSLTRTPWKRRASSQSLPISKPLMMHPTRPLFTLRSARCRSAAAPVSSAWRCIPTRATPARMWRTCSKADSACPTKATIAKSASTQCAKPM